MTLGFVVAVVVVSSFRVCRKVANANRPYSSATERFLRGEKYTEAFEGMVYRGSVEDARKLENHYGLVDSPPGRGSLCTLISGCIGNDIDVHNWAVERMYGSKDFATEAWIKKIEKIVPREESWFYVTYAHLANAVAAGTNNAAILKLQTSLREKGVAESICDVERLAAVLKSENSHKKQSWTDPREPRTIPGGKSLQDVFEWFEKVEQNGDEELTFQLLRAGTQYIKIDTGEHSWRCIGAGKTVSVHPGEKKHIWGEAVGLEIALGVPLFPATECSWLSNYVRTVYIRFSQSSEFNNTEKVDQYVVSLDLRKAYYVGGKKEVDYPFPFVNARPDMTQEEWECQRDLPGYLKDIERRIERYVKSCGPIEPNRRHVIKTKGEWSGRPEFDYVMFGDDGRSMACVEYFPKSGESEAEAVVREFNRANNRYELCLLKSDGSIVDCDSIENGKLERNKGEKFSRAFVLRVLARLNLTAEDMPDIDITKGTTGTDPAEAL